MNMKFVRTWAMLALVMVIGLSVTGGTIAWFTDSVESTGNVIQSGNLDMVVEYATSLENAKTGNWQELTEGTKLFNDKALYEPGYTELVYLRIANAGNLAFKCKADLSIKDTVTGQSVLGTPINLSEHMQIGVYTIQESRDGSNYWDTLGPIMFSGRETAMSYLTMHNMKEKNEKGLLNIANDLPLLPEGETASQIIVLALHMDEEVGNEANHKTGTAAPQINLGLNIVATQMTDEEDSFGSDYDAGATYPDGAQPSDLPTARVEALEGDELIGEFIPVTNWDEIGKNVENTKVIIDLDVGYKFKATETPAQAAQSPYRYYNADFVVTTNKPIEPGVIGLAGKYNYKGLPLPVAFDLDETLLKLKDGEDATAFSNTKEYRLLDGYFPTNYEEVCKEVVEFMCGAYICKNATSAQLEALKGTTLTVELRLFETVYDPELNNGQPSPIEVDGGKQFTIATYSHTFD